MRGRDKLESEDIFIGMSEGTAPIERKSVIHEFNTDEYGSFNEFMADNWFKLEELELEQVKVTGKFADQVITWMKGE